MGKFYKYWSRKDPTDLGFADQFNCWSLLYSIRNKRRKNRFTGAKNVA